mgnify:CR=1 FL=1
MSKKTLKYILLISAAIGLAGLGTATAAIATTNPELLKLVSKIAEYGLKGLQEYFDFLIRLFKEAIKAI